MRPHMPTALDQGGINYGSSANKGKVKRKRPAFGKDSIHRDAKMRTHIRTTLIRAG